MNTWRCDARPASSGPTSVDVAAFGGGVRDAGRRLTVVASRPCEPTLEAGVGVRVSPPDAPRNT